MPVQRRFKEKNTFRTTVVMSESLEANLRHCALNEGLSNNDLIKLALEEYLKKKRLSAR